MFDARKTQGPLGFTLMEMAIVLGLIGAVLGAVWGASSHFREQSRASKTLQQVMQVVQNIRAYYVNAAGILVVNAQGKHVACADNADITSTIATAQLLPAEMRNGANYISASGGSFSVLCDNENCVGDQLTRFWITLTNLTPSACVKLLMGLPYKDSSLGVVKVFASTKSGECLNPVAWATSDNFLVRCDKNNDYGLCETGTPTTLQHAIELCGNGGATSCVAWEFKLRN
ncbi:MAG: type II secretion system protein [Alphaproteobacteria bacterium]|nr:type II secretion system protein [Alphaproteobacteria bacterium]